MTTTAIFSDKAKKRRAAGQKPSSTALIFMKSAHSFSATVFSTMGDDRLSARNAVERHYSSNRQL